MNDIPKIKLPYNIYLSRQFFLSEKIVNPKRDWNILSILFAIFIVVSVGFDYYMYQQIVGGDMYVSVKKEELVIETLKVNDLQKIVDSFELKKNIIINIKIENLVDPSL